MIGQVLINGAPSDGRIPVTDSSVLRGDGCFEVVRAYRGRPFALGDHIDRLERSARAMEIRLPERHELAAWIEKVAAEQVDGAIRVVVTRGASVPGMDDPSLVIVFGHRWDRSEEMARLLPMPAPWHAAGVHWALAGAKTISYAPNLSATRAAQAQGFEDALLVSRDDTILEGPTFSVAWMVDDVLETPTLELGILDSITRSHLLEIARRIGIQVSEGSWRLQRLDAATEMMAWSTIREVQPVVMVGERRFPPGPITETLAVRFEEVVGLGTYGR